jgi:hypothetical protein
MTAAGGGGGGRGGAGASAYDPSLAFTVGYTKCLRDRVEEEALI